MAIKYLCVLAIALGAVVLTSVSQAAVRLIEKHPRTRLRA